MTPLSLFIVDEFYQILLTPFSYIKDLVDPPFHTEKIFLTPFFQPLSDPVGSFFHVAGQHPYRKSRRLPPPGHQLTVTLSWLYGRDIG